MTTSEDITRIVAHAGPLADAYGQVRNACVEAGGGSVGLNPHTLARDVAGLLVSLGLGDIIAPDIARGARPIEPEAFRAKWSLSLEDSGPRQRRAPLRAPYSDGNAATPGQHEVHGRSK